MLVLCATASESAFNTLSRVYVVKTVASSEKLLSPLSQSVIVSVIALVLCVFPAVFEHPLTKLAEIGLSGWLALLWNGVFVTALAFVCWYAGIKRCGAFTVATFSGMMPFTSLILSTMIFGDNIDYSQWLGGFIIIIGMFLIGLDGADIYLAKSNTTKAIEREQV